jgi:hypothetical protein
VLNDQQGDHTWEKQACLELLFDLGSEVLVHLGLLEGCLEIVDCRQTVREVLEETKHLTSAHPHELSEHLAFKLLCPILNAGGDEVPEPL